MKQVEETPTANELKNKFLEAMGGHSMDEAIWASAGVLASIVAATYKRKTADVYAKLFDAISQQIDLA